MELARAGSLVFGEAMDEASCSISIVVPIDDETVVCPGAPFVAFDLSKGQAGGLNNDQLGALNAQIWARTAIESDYVGFVRQSTYFDFSQEYSEDRSARQTHRSIEYLSEEETEKLGCSESEIRERIQECDLVLPHPEMPSWRPKSIFADRDTLRDEARSLLDFICLSQGIVLDDLNLMLEIISKRNPDLGAYANDYLSGRDGYFSNMFVMKKSLFDEYACFLSAVFEEFFQARNCSDYGTGTRDIGDHLGAFVCGLYLSWLCSTDVLVKHIDVVDFEDVHHPGTLARKYSDADDAIIMAFSSDDYFAPYLATLIASVLDNSSKDRCYDFIILTENMSQWRISEMKGAFENDRISLRFYNVRRLMRLYKQNLHLNGHFKIETYFRLLLPQILPEYHKVLYLDADMVCLGDVAQLFDQDVNGYLVAACKDPDTVGLHYGARPDRMEYDNNILHFEPITDYFQAGTILFNLDEWREKLDVEEVFSYAQSADFQLLDQDILNHFCHGLTKYVDSSWNVMVDWAWKRVGRIISLAPKSVYDEYMDARAHPNLVHYAGPGKPWTDYRSDFSEVFWRYARQSPFYEEIVSRTVHLDFDRRLDDAETRLDDLYRIIDELGRGIEERDREIIRLRESTTFKVGSFVTAPARALKDAIHNRREGRQ